MRPSALSLSNFRSHADTRLDLRGLDLAVISGQNGAGKSSLLEALCWALFGETQVASNDDLVRRGQDAMQVELEFELGDERYRIVRGRSLAGRGKSVLELYRAEGAGWQPLTGDKLADTESKIRDLLHLDYATFIASAVILQGRANEFTSRTPAGRKEILGQLLGLDVYPVLEARARERARAAKATAEQLQRRAAEAAIDLAARPTVEQALQTQRTALAEAEGVIITAEAACNAAMNRRAELLAATERRRGLKTRVATLRVDRAGLLGRAASFECRIRDCESLAAQIDGLRERSLELSELEAQDRQLMEALSARTEIERRTAQLEQGIQRRESSQREELQRLEIQIKNDEAQGALLDQVACDRRDCRFLQAAFVALERLPGLRSAREALASKDPAAQERDQLVQLRAELEAHAYSPRAHGQVRGKMRELQPVRAELARAEAATVELSAIREQAAALEREAADKAEAIRAAELELAASLDLSAELEAVVAELANHARGLQLARQQVADARRTLGTLEERLASLSVLAQRVSTWQAELAAAVRQDYVYSKLTEAFGRNGIPALIIENAVPELEAFANDLLGRMSAGRLSLRLDTQRLTKVGSVQESLEIVVLDGTQEAPYETFSGGERFRIDFALRVALAKLLATRAGATVQTLVIDEGLGSQDSEGRDLLLQAIEAARRDFQLVLLVTHIEDVRDRFPAEIRVHRGEGGSEVEVIVR